MLVLCNQRSTINHQLSRKSEFGHRISDIGLGTWVLGPGPKNPNLGTHSPIRPFTHSPIHESHFPAVARVLPAVRQSGAGGSPIPPDPAAAPPTDSPEAPDAACLFASDLHGHVGTRSCSPPWSGKRPAAVFLGGDLLPSGSWAMTADGPGDEEFLDWILIPGLTEVRRRSAPRSPGVPDSGHDDARAVERPPRWRTSHWACALRPRRRIEWAGGDVYGYARTFRPRRSPNKDWERYGRGPLLVDPAARRRTRGTALCPERAELSTAPSPRIWPGWRETGTRREAGSGRFTRRPTDTPLDRAALDGRNGGPRPRGRARGEYRHPALIEARQPRNTTGTSTRRPASRGSGGCNGGDAEASRPGAHDGPELALVLFDPERPDADRRLLPGRSARCPPAGARRGPTPR